LNVNNQEHVIEKKLWRKCCGETHVNGSSHPNHEKPQIIISTVLIRRGGAPPGAAALIIFGGRGVSTPIRNYREGHFLWEII
jgi:hypothetical protein